MPNPNINRRVILNKRGFDPIIYGNQLTDAFNRASVGSDYTAVGGITNSIVSNKLRIDTSNNDFTTYLKWLNGTTGNLGATTVEQFTQKIRFTSISTSVGLWIGTTGISQYNAMSFQCFFNTSSGGSRGFVSVFINGAFVAASASALTYTDGDEIDLTLNRNHFVWTLTATRVSTGVSVSKVHTLSPSSSASIENIGMWCVGCYNGQHDISSFTIDYNEYKYAKYAFVGHSIVQGFENATYTNRFADLSMSNLGFGATKFNVFASGGALVTEGLNNIAEIIAFRPQQVILMYGTNEASVGISTGTFGINYANLCSQLRGAGIIIKHCLVPPSGVVGWYASVPSYNVVITAEATTYNETVIDTFTPLVGVSPICNVALYAADVIHPNTAGHSVIASTIQPYL